MLLAPLLLSRVPEFRSTGSTALPSFTAGKARCRGARTLGGSEARYPMANPFQSTKNVQSRPQPIPPAAGPVVNSGTADRIIAEARAERGEDVTPAKGPSATSMHKLGSGFDVADRVATLIREGCPEAFAKQLATTEAQQQRGLSIGISAKGAASLYGLGRFPVTLYAGQWARLLSVASEIAAYLQAHESELATKGEAKAE